MTATFELPTSDTIYDKGRLYLLVSGQQIALTGQVELDHATMWGITTLADEVGRGVEVGGTYRLLAIHVEDDGEESQGSNYDVEVVDIIDGGTPAIKFEFRGRD